MKWLLAAWVVLVLVVHQDFWFRTDRTLIFGFLPIGMAYHAGYCLLASLTMWMLVRYAWPAHLEQPEGVPAPETTPAAPPLPGRPNAPGNPPL